MKISSGIEILLILDSAVRNDSLPLVGTKFPKRPFSRHLPVVHENQASSTPHPPGKPPPKEIYEKDLYYGTLKTDDVAKGKRNNNMSPTVDGNSLNGILEEQAVNGSTAKEAVNGSVAKNLVSGSGTQETGYEPVRIEIPEETKELSRKAAQKIFDSVIKPIAELQPGVPSDSIKGAALIGAALGVLTTKGVVITSAASLSAAYVAISQGILGDIFRTVGGFAWDATEAAATLYQKATASEKSTGMSKELAAKVMAAAATSNVQRYEAFEQTVLDEDVYESELYGEASETEVARVLREAESAISAADAAIAAADETLGAYEEDSDGLEAEAAKLEEEARLAEEEALKAEEEARLLAAENARAEEERLEDERLKAELFAAQEQVRIEEERRAAQEKAEVEAEISPDVDISDYDQDWEAAVALAQENLEGKIVGLEDAITDDSAKKEWDAAGALAQELQEGPYEEFDDEVVDSETMFGDIQGSSDEEFLFDDEVDTAAVAEAARRAVELYEEEVKVVDEAKQEQRDEWTQAMDVDEDDFGYENDESVLIAAEGASPKSESSDATSAIRAAVKRMAEDGESVEDDEDSFEFFENEIGVSSASPSSGPALRDWSELTVVRLKQELKARGLKSYGRKAELVKMLEQYDLGRTGQDQSVEDDSDVIGDDDEYDMLDVSKADLSEIARQARAAVEEFKEGGKTESSDSDDWLEEYSAVADLDRVGDKETSTNSDDWLEEFSSLTGLEELGKQARAAVDASFADEPSDEILKQLEIEEPLLFDEAGSQEYLDYESMTVAQLKDELRKKGLMVSGRKAELIERLLSS